MRVLALCIVRLRDWFLCLHWIFFVFRFSFSQMKGNECWHRTRFHSDRDQTLRGAHKTHWPWIQCIARSLAGARACTEDSENWTCNYYACIYSSVFLGQVFFVVDDQVPGYAYDAKLRFQWIHIHGPHTCRAHEKRSRYRRTVVPVRMRGGKCKFHIFLFFFFVLAATWEGYIAINTC